MNRCIDINGVEGQSLPAVFGAISNVLDVNINAYDAILTDIEGSFDISICVED